MTKQPGDGLVDALLGMADDFDTEGHHWKANRIRDAISALRAQPDRPADVVELQHLLTEFTEWPDSELVQLCLAPTPGEHDGEPVVASTLGQLRRAALSRQPVEAEGWRALLQEARLYIADFDDEVGSNLLAKIDAALSNPAASDRAEKMRPVNGSAGDAIDFALSHYNPEEAVEFLDYWRTDRAEEWPDYVKWLEVQYRDRAALQGESK